MRSLRSGWDVSLRARQHRLGGASCTLWNVKVLDLIDLNEVHAKSKLTKGRADVGIGREPEVEHAIITYHLDLC